jgi:hypothetical protein
MLPCIVWYKFTDVSEESASSIFLKTTRNHVPEDSAIHNHRGDWVTIDGVWIGNRIYWTFTERNYK